MEDEVRMFKDKLKTLSPEEIDSLYDQICHKIKLRDKPKKKFWFDRNITGLDADGKHLLNAMEKRLKDGTFGPSRIDMKQIGYLRKLDNMKIQVPSFYREVTEPKALYHRLASFCQAHDIPEMIIGHIVPSLISYIETGRMRPLILVGEMGCGKTTALKLLVEEALQIPACVVKVPQVDSSHGMTGHCGSFANADVGILSKVRLRNNRLINAYIFDEIDKAVRSGVHACVEDELLSVTDESINAISDNYLDVNIVALEHCPMFFTANNLKNINPILVDRCSVVEFPNADTARIRSICSKYVKNKMSGSCYELIEFDYGLMDKYIDILVESDVTSLRKHQQLIEKVLESALDKAFKSPGMGKTSVTEDMFIESKDAILGITKRKIGFAS